MDWKTTALVVIDMENAFISKESPLCIQEAAKSGIRRVVVPGENAMEAAVRDSGILCEPHLSQKRQ
mgnify:CR=1 FL=1